MYDYADGCVSERMHVMAIFHVYMYIDFYTLHLQLVFQT